MAVAAFWLTKVKVIDIKAFRITVLLALIGWMIMIFYLSDQTADVSSQTSGGLIKTVLSIVIPNFDELSADEQLKLCESLQFFVRKGAHFTIYCILGILSFLNLVTYKNISITLRTVISAVFCLLYSISDEIHQLFIEGRSGEVRDVFIDFCGALLGILILRFAINTKRFKGKFYEKK